MSRFYLPPQDWLAAAPQLSEADTHHCKHVLRCHVDDAIVIFDGEGKEAEATILDFQKKKNSVALLKIGAEKKTPRARCAITLAQAVPKAKNMDLIIQKAVELGAARIVPLLAERTILRCHDEHDALQKQERWQQIAIEACKQSGQNWLPRVEKPITPKEFFSTHLAHHAPADALSASCVTAPVADSTRAPIISSKELLLIASLESERSSLKKILTAASHPTHVTIMIGPEGDFTPIESASARHAGFQPVDLGPIILRTETAAIYSLSVLAHELF